ncbi:MAG: ABC transporter ATP-binding protein, partial [Anaerolineales bacterium]|nr:ABC transporter ATP-binding protein [Anaerolineales bacterium]
MDLLKQETLKPRNVGNTIARFGKYFGKFWYVLVLAMILIIVSTWTQVTSPELTGQATDCFLVPNGTSAFASFSGEADSASEASASACWIVSDPATLSGTQKIIATAYRFNDFKIIDPATASTEERIAGLWRLILIVIGLFVLGAIVTGMLFFTMSWTGQHVLRELKLDLFNHLHKLSLSYYADHEAGDLMSRITNDTSAIEQAFSFALVQVFSGILLLVWTAYNMIVRSVPFALLSLVIAPIMFFVTYYFSTQARKAFRVAREEIGSVNSELQETISAVREVQAFNRADENIENFKEVNAANRDANVRAVSFTSALAPALEALSYVALGIVVGVGGWALLRGGDFFGSVVTLGLVVTFLQYVQRFNQPIQQIAVLWTNIQNAIAGGERIFNILDEKPAIADKADAKEMKEIKGLVEFENVAHEYEDGVPVLRGVSFTAQPGQTFAIVGPTGAGKTTIINLLPRFYDVTQGSVKIDGVDVRDVKAESIRKQVGIVLQDTFLFSTTVMENVRFGKPDATDEEVMAAIKLANADSFIERLPEKYQTV